MSDILVVLLPLTADGSVIFAKNSDRPPTEVQEVFRQPVMNRQPNCTYLLRIEECLAVLLRFEECLVVLLRIEECLSELLRFEECLAVLLRIEECLVVLLRIEECLSELLRFEECLAVLLRIEECLAVLLRIEECLSELLRIEECLAVLLRIEECLAVLLCIVYRFFGSEFSDQIPDTRGVILSKPAWCWGAEMGANDRGVCIGNTAVWTRLCRPGDHEEKLIEMYLVRLGLERSSKAREAIDVISGLLVTHGQGGICSEDHNFGQWTYHKSFVIADKQEAWLLETADKMWAAKKLTNSVLAVSSSLTIGTDADMTSLDLNDYELNFAKAFSADYPGISLSEKQTPGNRLNFVQNSLHSLKDKINISHVFKILRNEESSVNFIGELLTVGSQVSVLAPPTSNQPCCRWFTGTPNANVSIFKPFVFCDSPNIGKWTLSSTFGDTPRASLQTTIYRRHALYRAHEKGRELMETGSSAGVQLHMRLRRLEAQCVREVMKFVKRYRESDMSEVRDLFSDIAESEIKFYSRHKTILEFA
ncbi:SCRN2-like protein [Mya arenaria]|uniref:SCRN2-like protein n=1 Tax=Mya arenaria TaxID=6604 RepID=A0ABY7DCS8_MYAAR|nr:SCRN2-like protein [Mya arenaria]